MLGGVITRKRMVDLKRRENFSRLVTKERKDELWERDCMNRGKVFIVPYLLRESAGF